MCPWWGRQMFVLINLLGTFLMGCNCSSFPAGLTSLVEELWFLLHILVLLIFLLCQISEVSDYVSIKHILCPAIRALIAGEKENPLGAVNNGLLFIRGHSSEVGKTCNRALSFHTDDNVFKNSDWGLQSFNPANNKEEPKHPTAPCDQRHAESWENFGFQHPVLPSHLISSHWQTLALP